MLILDVPLNLRQKTRTKFRSIMAIKYTAVSKVLMNKVVLT